MKSKPKKNLDLEAYIQRLEKECARAGVDLDKVRKGVLVEEGFYIPSLYLSEDSSGAAYPGVYPFKRGPYASMYTLQPWTIRQYAGFSTAEASNAFYKQALRSGQKGLSVAFDLATHRGYDSDHPRVEGDVGKAGVAIDSVEDMKILFDGISLKDVSVSMTMNGAVLPVLAAFLVCATEQGCSLSEVSGTIQNDILKEYLVRNTYIYPPQPSMRICGDIIAFCAENAPRFNAISISGYHIHEAGADAALELALTMADGRAYVEEALSRGLDIDHFAPRLSFFFGIGMNFLREIAKLRAARVLWAEIISGFKAKKPESMMLRTHCQTSGWSLTEQDPYNNIVRTTVEAMAAVLGGTQSLHTNSFDEAIALPTEFSSRIARNTQLILQHETDLSLTADPLGGSYAIEGLTQEILVMAREIIKDIDSRGGILKCIETGFAKGLVEKAAAKKQAKIDRGEKTIVGVNRYRLEKEDSVEYLNIDTVEVLKNQKVRLAEVKRKRSDKSVKDALDKLKACAASQGNLLEASIEAMRVRATLGEVSFALEEVFKRYQNTYSVVSSVYGAGMQDDPSYENARKLLLDFRKERGRNPRILIAKLGQDGHDRGARVVAAGFSDLGFDVDLGGMFMTPDEVVQQAMDNDVHVIGISSQAGAHKTLVPQLIEILRQRGEASIQVIVGGIIPRAEYDSLKALGVAAIFGPGTPVSQAAEEVLGLLASKNRVT